MDFIEAFAVLGIEKTEDKGIIKKAYRELLIKNNPEDHPEEFKRLRLAYETASKYMENEEEEEREEEDNTPSGLVVAEFKKIYENISLRRDPAVFEKFFSKDIFLSLDEDELCREKILVFMMGHYFFPTEVWKILDRSLRIQAGENELKEKFPADYINFIIAKCNNGEEVNFSQFEGAENADYDEFIHYSEKIYQALREEKTQEAEQYLRAADQMGIYNPVMELARASIFRVKGMNEEGCQILKTLYEKYPEDETARYNYAEALWNVGKRDQAAEIYKMLKAANDNHYMANVRLTEWYYDHEEYETAKKHAYCVLKYGCDDNFRDLLQRINDELELQYKNAIAENNNYKDKMELCWCYLQSERLFESLDLALSIEKEVGEQDRTEYIGMLAKIYIECGMFKESEMYARQWLEALEKELPDEYERKINTAHYLIAEALHFRAGSDESLFSKATESLESLGEKLENEIGFMIKLAYIYADAGKVKECERIAQFLEKRRIFVGHIALLECYNTVRDANGILEQSKVVVRYFPDMPRPYELALRVFYDHDLKNGMKDVLDLAEQNGVTSDYLTAYRKLYERKDRPSTEDMEERVKKVRTNELRSFRRNRDDLSYKEGIRLLTRCFEDAPCGYLLVERGLFYLEAQKYAEAQKDFEKALEGDLFNQYAWNALGGVFLAQSEYDKAFTCYNKSIAVSGEDYILPYENIADCYQAIGDYERALKQYQLIFSKFNRKEEDYFSDMMEVYKNLGMLDEAMRLADAHSDHLPVAYCESMLCVAMEMGKMELAEKIRKSWKKSLGVLFPGLPVKDEKYCREVCWYYLLRKQERDFGDYQKALALMDTSILAEQGKKLDRQYFEKCEEMLFLLYLGIPMHELPGKSAKYLVNMEYLHKNSWVMGSRKKYRLYILVLEAICSNDFEKARQMLEQMDQCPKCPGCNLAVCKELMIAKGMLLEMQGDDGYRQIYKELMERYPHDKYIMALYKYKVL